MQFIRRTSRAPRIEAIAFFYIVPSYRYASGVDPSPGAVDGGETDGGVVAGGLPGGDGETGGGGTSGGGLGGVGLIGGGTSGGGVGGCGSRGGISGGGFGGDGVAGGGISVGGLGGAGVMGCGSVGGGACVGGALPCAGGGAFRDTASNNAARSFSRVSTPSRCVIGLSLEVFSNEASSTVESAMWLVSRTSAQPRSSGSQGVAMSTVRLAATTSAGIRTSTVSVRQ
jgi:hypothetical protein